MVEILMIEDDLELAEILSEFLQTNQMNVSIVDEPYLGLSTINTRRFDLIILDLTLPGLDGLEVCKEIRKNHNTPIIISSARHDITDKVNALDFGADDYLPKPYDPKELLARIKSLLRRQSASLNAPNDTINKDLVLKEFEHEILFKGTPLNLTIAEYDILRHLIIKQGGAVSREELIYNCESLNEESTSKSIDVMIGRIRSKLGENPKEPRYIHAIRGIGYKLVL